MDDHLIRMIQSNNIIQSLPLVYPVLTKFLNDECNLDIDETEVFKRVCLKVSDPNQFDDVMTKDGVKLDKDYAGRLLFLSRTLFFFLINPTTKSASSLFNELLLIESEDTNQTHVYPNFDHVNQVVNDWFKYTVIHLYLPINEKNPKV